MTTPAPGVHHVALDTDAGTSEMVVHVPDRARSGACGVVVLLHGAGGSGPQLGWLAEALCAATGMHVLCPTATVVDGKGSFELGGLMGQRVRHPRWQHGRDGAPMRARAWALAHLGADPARCLLAGHSMGAVATWNVAARFPCAWAGIAPINGALSVWELFGPDATAAALLPNLLSVPILALHGSADRRIPPDLEAASLASLQALGHTDARQWRVPGGDHPLATMGLQPGAAHFDGLATWLAAQRRDPHPRRLSHCTVEAGQGRNHWIEIDELAPGQRRGTVEAEASCRRNLVLRTRHVRRLTLHLHHRLLDPGLLQIDVNGLQLQHLFVPHPGPVAEQRLQLDGLDEAPPANMGETPWTSSMTC